MNNVFYALHNLGTLSAPPFFLRSSNGQNGQILLFHDYIMFRSLIPLFLVIGIGQVPRFLIWLGCMYVKILEGSKVPKREGAEAADVDIKAKKKLFSYTRSPFIHRSTLFHYRHGRRWN